jgi:endonuclease/exonuclease/phosphatase family metal-dependent hydrolase
MASKLRIFTKKLFIYCNGIILFFFVLACLVPYLNPQKWWYISFLGLAFPFLLLLVLFCLAGWILIFKPRYILMNSVFLLLGYKSISNFIAFNKPVVFNKIKNKNDIRILTWNVARFIELKRNTNEGSQKRIKMLELIKQQDADIVCLQEFHTSADSAYYDNITPIKGLGYPFYYFSFDEDGTNHYYSSIIFSRYPIIDSGLIRYPRPTLPDALIHADIKVNDDTVRIYTTHLQSLQFGKKEYETIEKLTNAEEKNLSGSRNLITKLKRGITNRSIQSDLISNVLGDSPNPVIFCVDLNDVANSYSYATVKGDMQDAFLKKGFGIGRTFSAISPTLRIDYIFAGNQFDIHQFNRIINYYSDHFMLVSDVHLKK